MQHQVIVAAQKGKQLSQKLAELLRDIGAATNHVTATGLTSSLTTIKTEYAAFDAWDQTGSIPEVNGFPVAKINPQYKEEFIIEYREQRDGNGIVIVDGETQYDVITVRNRAYTPSIEKYIFVSSTGIDVDNDGEIVGLDQSIDEQLVRLQVAGLLSAYLETDPDTSGKTLLERIESVTTV